ncbi:MAG TPA: phosphoribosylanthranilate isomerase [Pseudomonadales bacterium]
MSVVRVKICGLTDPGDALMACEAGADAIGLVFYAPSSRFVSCQQAADISRVVPPFVQRVGLFVNPTVEQVQVVLEQVELDLLQFHGQETPAFCTSFRRPYIKAFAMRDDFDLAAAMADHDMARGFLLDAYHPALPGGTGQAFDWQRFPQQAARPLILAGGLTPDNVCEAIAQCRPWAVDVSGGVESSPGIKSAERVLAFIQRAKQTTSET